MKCCIMEKSSLSCRVWIFTALFLDHIDNKHQTSLWWIAWRGKGTVIKPLKAMKNLNKISVNTLVSLLRKAQIFYQALSVTSTAQRRQERAQFLPSYAASPVGRTNRRTKHKVSLRTHVLSLRNCSWSSSLLHQKTRARQMCISCQI